MHLQHMSLLKCKTPNMLLASILPEYQQFDTLLALRPSDTAHEGVQCMQLCPIDCKLYLPALQGCQHPSISSCTECSLAKTAGQSGGVAARREQTVRTARRSSILLLNDIVVRLDLNTNSSCKDMTNMMTCFEHGARRWQRHRSRCAPVAILQRCSSSLCQHAVVAKVVFDSIDERGH